MLASRPAETTIASRAIILLSAHVGHGQRAKLDAQSQAVADAANQRCQTLERKIEDLAGQIATLTRQISKMHPTERRLGSVLDGDEA